MIDFKCYKDTTAQIDSCTLKIIFEDKSSQQAVDSLFFLNIPHLQKIFENCDSMRSYSTGLNSKNQIVDNYFGDVVTADLNFDGLDDIAIINDSGGNGGSPYQFFLQTPDKKFVLDNFLTDSVIYFPHTIDQLKHRLITCVHASAYAVNEDVYQYNGGAGWRHINRKTIGE